MLRAIIESTLFLVFTMSLLAYVAMELSQFNDAVSRELVYSYRFNVKQTKVSRELALNKPVSK